MGHILLSMYSGDWATVHDRRDNLLKNIKIFNKFYFMLFQMAREQTGPGVIYNFDSGETLFSAGRRNTLGLHHRG